MDVTNSAVVNGSLQISTEVIAKIARLAAMEIDGVKEVCTTSGMKSILGRPKMLRWTFWTMWPRSPCTWWYITAPRSRPSAKEVQENVKAAVQNMTQITVSRVNVVVVGVQVKAEPAEIE